jgi:hypothetical protein
MPQKPSHNTGGRGLDHLTGCNRRGDCRDVRQRGIWRNRGRRENLASSSRWRHARHSCAMSATASPSTSHPSTPLGSTRTPRSISRERIERLIAYFNATMAKPIRWTPPVARRAKAGSDFRRHQSDFGLRGQPEISLIGSGRRAGITRRRTSIIGRRRAAVIIDRRRASIVFDDRRRPAGWLLDNAPGQPDSRRQDQDRT